MLKIQTKSQNISEEEIKNIDLENQRKMLEGACFDATEAKRKIEKDIVKIQENIKVGKDTIEQNNKKINETNQNILDVQNSLRLEQQKLQELEKYISVKKEEFKAEAVEKDRQLKSIISVITSSDKTRQDNRSNGEEELKSIKDEQSQIINEVKTLQYSLVSINREVEVKTNNLENVKEEITSLDNIKTLLDSSIGSLKNEIENQKGIIENNKVVLDQCLSSIKEKEKEVSDLKINIFKKEDEYKAIESKAFQILSKQQILDNREAFLKGQYERAGIKWE